MRLSQKHEAWMRMSLKHEAWMRMSLKHEAWMRMSLKHEAWMRMSLKHEAWMRMSQKQRHEACVTEVYGVGGCGKPPRSGGSVSAGKMDSVSVRERRDSRTRL